MTMNHVKGDSFREHDEYRPLENPFRAERPPNNSVSIFHLSKSASNTRSSSPRRKRTHRSGTSLTLLVGSVILVLVALNFYLFTLIAPDISLPVTSIENVMRKHFVSSGNRNSIFKDNKFTDDTTYSLFSALKSYADITAAWRRTELEHVQSTRQLRASQRRDRTLPPASLADEPMIPLYHPLHHPKSEDTSTQILYSTYEESNHEPNSTMKLNLCGVHANNASILHPQHYKHHHSLNNSSKVLITGILSPIGFHLALKLATQCNVEVMLAVDPIYPNHFIHRLRAQQYIGILARMIPKLQMPIVIPFVGLDRRTPPQDSRKSIFFHTTGEINYSLFKVTHIIHLASSDPYLYRDFLDDKYPERYQYDHTYAAEDRLLGHLYGFRQSLVSMEQLLMGLSTSAGEDIENDGTIQFTYATTTSMIYSDDSDPQKVEDQDFFATVKAMDELMARTYGKLKQVSSVALRLPTVYGPIGRQGSLMYELAEKASKHWSDPKHLNHTNNANSTNNTNTRENESCLLDMIGYKGSADLDMKDLLFVDDAVDAILASMQFSSESSGTTTLDISSGRSIALKDLAAFVERQMAVGKVQPATQQDTTDSFIPQVEISNNLQQASNTTNHLIQWSPATTLETGLRRLLSWHLDKYIPYGSSSDLSDIKSNASLVIGKENGNDYLIREKVDLCDPDDLYCLRDKLIYPCMSECASLKQCTTSPYDDVKELSWSFSIGCHTVVYTSFIGRRLNDLNHSAPTLIDQRQKDTKDVCSLAFLPKESLLITEVVKNITQGQLMQMNVSDRLHLESDSGRLSRLMNEINGRVSYRGWTLIWMSNSDDLSKVEHSNVWMAALSPKRLFHPSVKYAMYLADATILTPSSEDVLFLTSQMSRPALLPGKAKQHIGLASSDRELGLSSEPERKVGLLVGALRIAPADDPLSISPWNNKISWLEARMKMSVEITGREDVNETQSVQRQRESYERITAFVNSPQLRSPYAKLYKYDFYHWPRTRWLLHDLEYETSRKFRCDWYKEHISWQSDYEQLSFAHLMAQREVERRILRNEPDDLSRRAVRLKEDPDIDRFTDRNSWHLIIDPYEDDLLTPYTAAEPFVDEPKEDRILVDTEESKTEDALDTTVNATKTEEKDIYVRIMGELWAKFYRQRWDRDRDNE